MDDIQVNVYGVKCDNGSCDYNDESIKFEEYPEWINKPCPECGANLLTQEDYDFTVFLVKMAAYANAVLPHSDQNEAKIKISVELNGTGEVNIRTEEYKK